MRLITQDVHLVDDVMHALLRATMETPPLGSHTVGYGCIAHSIR
jgi:hypothetical protein